ncbi:MAG: hypothetical protein J6T73_02660, partial [Clostridia bacterium]|nr:hypothetical protein [Clostridia bacterium]
KKLIPALAMLLVSAILLGTSTYAWFSMNTVVSATNMQVKAIADQGILINEVATAADTNWDEAATANQTTALPLRATSTANTVTWYTANSKKSSSAADATANTPSTDLVNGYTTLSATASTTAAVAGTNAARDIYYVDADGNSAYDDGEAYYVRYTYYIKSSADQITPLSLADGAQNLRIKAVTAEPATNNSADIDAALRVAVVLGGKAYIFAPVTGADTSYYVNAGATATTALTAGDQATALTSIPAKTSDGTAVYVYIYFEGEDNHLKTDNVVNSLDNIDVTVQFELYTNNTGAALTDNGVSTSVGP